MTSRDRETPPIQVDIGTLVLPSASLAAATKAAAELQRELSALLSQSGSVQPTSDTGPTGRPVEVHQAKALSTKALSTKALSTKPGDIAAAIHRTIVDSSKQVGS